MITEIKNKKQNCNKISHSEIRKTERNGNTCLLCHNCNAAVLALILTIVLLK